MSTVTNPPIKGEKGDRGPDGDSGLKGLPGTRGEPGEMGDPATAPFEPVFIYTSVGSDRLTSFVIQDTVDGGRKLAFPLSGNVAHGMTIERHPNSTYMTLGSRIILPDEGIYEYSFEVYVRNLAGAPQDFYAQVPLKNSGTEAVLSSNHVVKNVGPNAVAKITGKGFTWGVYNAFVAGGPQKRTFFVKIDSSTQDSFALPNGNDDDFSGDAPEEARHLVHSLVLKKVSNNVFG